LENGGGWASFSRPTGGVTTNKVTVTNPGKTKVESKVIEVAGLVQDVFFPFQSGDFLGVMTPTSFSLPILSNACLWQVS